MKILLLNIYKSILEIFNSKWKIIFPILIFIISYILLVRINGIIYYSNKFPNELGNILDSTLKSFSYILVFFSSFYLFLFIGHPNKSSKLEHKLKQIGLTNSLHEPPYYLGCKQSYSGNHKSVYSFYANTLSLDDFKEKQNKLEAVFNAKIISISYKDKSKQKILITTIPMKYYAVRGIDVNNPYLSDIVNCCIVGATGSGKTYTVIVLLTVIIKNNTQSSISIIFCDYKNSFKNEFSECKQYFGYSDCLKGLNEVYTEFETRLKEAEPENCSKIIFIFDEWSAFLNSLPKKEKELTKNKLSSLLFMGRSLNIIPIVSVQRADSELFPSGSRDQFHTIIDLGNLSKEQKSMLFHEYKDQLNEINHLGQGYILNDGVLERIKVKEMSNEKECIDIIRSKLQISPCECGNTNEHGEEPL